MSDITKLNGIHILGTASLFDFDIVLDNPNALTSFSSTLVDKDLISDFCHYVSVQPQPLTGLFFLNFNSDVFNTCSDTAFLRIANKHCNQHGIYVNVSCINDNILKIDDLYKEFLFKFSVSDNQLAMDYTDGFCMLQKNFQLSAQPFSAHAKNRIMDDYFSDCSDFPQIQVPGLINCALVCVDAQSPITQIDCIDCIPMASNFISDSQELCELVHCACDIQHCLESIYGNISDKIDHKCCVTYTGPVGAVRVRVDLENCKIFYEDFFVPGCSDVSIK